LSVKIAVALAVAALLGTALSAGPKLSSSRGSLDVAMVTKAATAGRPPTRPCQSSLTAILTHPKQQVGNYLFVPATGTRTPQAVIREVVGSEDNRGLMAMCPFITSEEVFDVAATAVLFTGGATPPAMVRTLLKGAAVPAQSVTIKKLRCTASRCTAMVTSSSSSSGSNSKSTQDVQATRYGSKWFLSQYLLANASGSS